MKVVNTGNSYRIYDDSVKVFDTLPANTYSICFSRDAGFWMESRAPLCINEKVYGVHEEKVTKVMDAFKKFDRNLGVILSGDKGIGKSMFARMLAIFANNAGYPVLIADRYIPGIANYIDSIEQEVVVLFDEFDKTFGKASKEDGARLDPQTEMLSLFDGVSSGKKLFVITCNEIRELNDYLINRPGRFHYHFRFDYPTASEIMDYMKDHLNAAYHGEIHKVISFAQKTDINYDCLRSIAFELNNGIDFSTAIKDLNIMNMKDMKYRVELRFQNGESLRSDNVRLDLFDPTEDNIFWLNGNKGEMPCRVQFMSADCIYNADKAITFVDAENVRILWDDDPDGDEKVVIDRLKDVPVSILEIRRDYGRSMHYML